MDRERIVQIFFFGFLALIAYELYEVVSPFLTPIAWAILLAFLAHPALLEVNRLLRSRTLSATFITIIVTLGVLLPAVWLSERLVAESRALYGEISELTTSGGVARVGDWIRASHAGVMLDAALKRRGIRLEDEIRNFTVQGVTAVSNYVVSHGGSVAGNVASSVFHFAIALLTFFYLLRDGESYYEALRRLTPLHEEDKVAIFETLRATLSAVMRGLMLTALLDGVSIGLAYLACGVPYWAFLAILTAAAGLLPVGGTSIVWIPVTVYLVVEDNWGAAILLVGWSLVTLAIVDNFIKPLAMKHGTGLPALALFFGLAGGLEAYGPLGIFAGPAVVAIFAALLRVYQKTYIGGQESSGDKAQEQSTPRQKRSRLKE